MEGLDFFGKPVISRRHFQHCVPRYGVSHALGLRAAFVGAFPPTLGIVYR